MRFAVCALLVCALSLAGCGGLQPGTLQVAIYGEAFAEEGIPSATFADGWSVTFTRFSVNLGNVTVAAGHGSAILNQAAYRRYDLTQPSGGLGQEVALAPVPGAVYDHVAYRIDGLQVAGSAEKDGVTKQFDWTFPTRTRYGACHIQARVDGTTARSVITIHTDHLFYDDLFAEEPDVALELLARADANGDGAVTQAELAAFDLATQPRYQVGSTGISNLWDFLAYQTTTVGHIDGEGHCDNITRE